MPGKWLEFGAMPLPIRFGLYGLAGLVAVAIALWAYRRSRPTAAELERIRRANVNRTGKISNGEVVEINNAAIVYSYSVAGVGYLATQDISTLESFLPENRTLVIGPVSLKHDRRNPANSIVFCEEWSGLRRDDRAARQGNSGTASQQPVA